MQVDYPLAKGVSLTTLAGKQIAAKDIDFSTKAITFEFTEDSEYFELKPGSPSSHNFPVDIIAKKVLNLQQPVTLTLKATDDGQDPEAKSATTTITIQPGENSTPPNPEFEEPYYQGKQLVIIIQFRYIQTIKWVHLELYCSCQRPQSINWSLK